MTRQQAQWLREHPDFEPVGRSGPGLHFVAVEHLLPNGSLASAASDEPVNPLDGVKRRLWR